MVNVKEKNNGAKVTPQESESITEKGKVTESKGGERYDLPSREKVGDWCKRDLRSAIYLLSWIETHPDLLQQIVDGIYEEAKRGPKLP